MRGRLRQRIDRLERRLGHGAGRLIVLEVAVERSQDHALVASTLGAAGLAPGDRDLLVKVRRFCPDLSDPPCTVVSVTALGPVHQRSPR